MKKLIFAMIAFGTLSAAMPAMAQTDSTAPAMPVKLEYFRTAGNAVEFKLAAFYDVSALMLEHSTNGIDFKTVQALPLTVAAQRIPVALSGLYRLRTDESNGSHTYTSTLRITLGEKQADGLVEVYTEQGQYLGRGYFKDLKLQRGTPYILRGGPLSGKVVFQ